MKKMIATLALPLTAMLFCSQLWAQKIDFSGEVATNWGVFAPGTENAGNLSVGITEFTPTLEAYAGNSSLFVEGTISYDAITNTPSWELKEAYIDYSSAFWGVRIGPQKTAWGKADGVDIVNSVFPNDSTNLYSEDSALPINAVRLNLSINQFTIDAFWIPFFKANTLPLDGVNLVTPELNLKNAEYGIKASGYFSFCDISLYGFYGWDKTPLISYKFDDNLTVCGEYKNLLMLGFDSAIPIGPTVLRLESAVFPGRHFATDVTGNQIMALCGLDWMPEGWTVTGQYYCDILPAKSDSIERESFIHSAILSVSKNLLNETLELSLAGILNLNDFDSVIKLSGKYSVSDQIALSVGSTLFFPGPDNDGTYGNLKDYSSINIKLSFMF